ncbi:hypothetical protein Lal_00019876 [Lupinus albus]|nr:hypothetical protein Lal_00019876 [Lupinus albus]
MTFLSLIKIYLSISLFFFILPLFSLSRSTFPISKHLHSYLPKTQAESLIRSFNLFPKYNVNIIACDTAFLPGSIVENKVSFLDVSRPSVLLKSLVTIQDFTQFFIQKLQCKNYKRCPVIIWLTGGAGCSNSLALFYENDPFKIANNMSLVLNQYGWDKASNILFVDQPTGTQVSATLAMKMTFDMMKWVLAMIYMISCRLFFKKHTELVKNDFYITGESYARHYIPALASWVHKGNIKKQGIHINLKGFAIGNELTNPAIQYRAYSDFALRRGLITKKDQDSLNKLIPNCEQDMKNCQTEGGDSCGSAYKTCTNIFDYLLSIIGKKGTPDIRKKCEGDMCYDFSNNDTFLNNDKVKDALGVKDLDFVSCSNTLFDDMLEDWMKNLEVDIPSLLEDGIKLLVYVGEEDLICNWFGNYRWVRAMKWSGQKKFMSALTIKFIVDSVEAGDLTSYGPLSFLKVFQAGHMVPMDQPKASLEMFTRWMGGKLYGSKK